MVCSLCSSSHGGGGDVPRTIATGSFSNGFRPARPEVDRGMCPAGGMRLTHKPPEPGVFWWQCAEDAVAALHEELLSDDDANYLADTTDDDDDRACVMECVNAYCYGIITKDFNSEYILYLLSCL